MHLPFPVSWYCIRPEKLNIYKYQCHSLQVFKTRPTSMDLTSSIAVLLLASAVLGIPLDQTVKLTRSGVLLSGFGVQGAY